MENFYNYCIIGNLEKIKKLNLTLEDIRSLDNYAFRYASYYGHLEIVKYLITFGEGASPPEMIEKGLTLEDIRSFYNFALIWASSNRHLEVVKYLYNLGLTLDDIRSKDNAALRWASESGHLEVVKYLIDKGLTLKDIRSENNYALKWASENGQIEVVKYLEETIKILKAKEEHKKEWDYICGEIEYKPELGIEYFKHLEEFIK